MRAWTDNGHFGEQGMLSKIARQCPVSVPLHYEVRLAFRRAVRITEFLQQPGPSEIGMMKLTILGISVWNFGCYRVRREVTSIGHVPSQPYYSANLT